MRTLLQGVLIGGVVTEHSRNCSYDHDRGFGAYKFSLLINIRSRNQESFDGVGMELNIPMAVTSNYSNHDQSSALMETLYRSSSYKECILWPCAGKSRRATGVLNFAQLRRHRELAKATAPNVTC